jgi:hypothetical protein
MKSGFRFPGLIALAAAIVAAGQDAKAQPLFESNDVLRVQIEAPFTTLMRDRESGEYVDGLFHIMTESGIRETQDLKIRTRGNYRRREENCEFAPLRLDFPRKKVRDTLLDGQDKLKLVTHCDDSRRSYEQSVLLEYLAYRILNELTDLSFRVRLLHIDYINTDLDNKARTKYGILIEDEEALLRRIDMQFAAIPSIMPEQLDPQQTALVAVFEYLIGNTDFSPLRGARDEFCCHNVILASKPGSGLMPIPYDFDLSGLVDAPYASPNPKYRIKKVTQRLYLGYCMHNELLPGVVGAISEQRPAITALVAAQEGLLEGSRQTALRFIDKFYERLSDDAGIQKYLVKECL